MKIWKFHSILAALVVVAACSSSPEKRTSETPTTPAEATDRYYGFIDKRDCDTVAGWVMERADPAADIKVDLHIDDKLVESVPAKELRQDLLGKVGTGRYGFTFKLPTAYKDAKEHIVSVKVADSKYNVPFFQGVIEGFKCSP